MTAYNLARRLKTLGGLTPYEYICKTWTSKPDRFILDPIHQMPGPISQGQVSAGRDATPCCPSGARSATSAARCGCPCLHGRRTAPRPASQGRAPAERPALSARPAMAAGGKFLAPPHPFGHPDPAHGAGPARRFRPGDGRPLGQIRNLEPAGRIIRPPGLRRERVRPANVRPFAGCPKDHGRRPFRTGRLGPPGAMPIAGTVSGLRPRRWQVRCP